MPAYGDVCGKASPSLVFAKKGNDISLQRQNFYSPGGLNYLAQTYSSALTEGL